MPTKQQLISALRNADKAGDIQAAKQIANALKRNQFDDASRDTINVAAVPPGTINKLPPVTPDQQAMQDAERIAKRTPGGANAGFSQGLREAGQGVGQVAMTLANQAGDAPVNRSLPKDMRIPNRFVSDEELNDFNQSVIQQRQQYEGQYADIPSAKAGQFLGKTAPYAAIPGVSSVPAAALLGAGIGASEFAENPADRQDNILLGGAIGGGSVAALKGIGYLASLAKNPAAIKEGPELTKAIDETIDSTLSGKTIDRSIREQLHADMKQAIKTGTMDDDVARRLVDYRTVGATPTAGPLSQDPGIISRQKNLAKIAVNTDDPNLQRLPQIENENNAQLIRQMNKLGAGSGDDIDDAIKTINTLSDIEDDVRKTTIDPLYNEARGEQGRSIDLDSPVFVGRANDMLADEMVGGSLPSGVRNILNKVSKGEIPLTVDVAEQLKTKLFYLQKTLPKFGADGQTKRAINIVRSALEETPAMANSGQDAIDAFNRARSASKNWANIVDKTPALKAARDGIEPDKFMQDYIIGKGKNASEAAVRNLADVLDNDPGAKSVIRNYMSRYLKGKALSGAEDEVGKFSHSAYNKALKSIGDRKLSYFYTKDEIGMLKSIGKVASYEQTQPIGSAVNNSNTAGSTISSVLDWLGNVQILRRIPFGAQVVGNPAKSVSQNIEASKMLKIPVKTKPKRINNTPSRSAPVGAGVSSVNSLRDIIQENSNQR